VHIDRRAILAAISSATMLAIGSQAWAQAPEEFYKGKTLDLVIGYAPGGSNDVWGRMLSRHLGKHIPGRPNVVPKNMPGAGSFLAVNQIFNVLPKDGTILGIGAPTMALDEKLGSQGVRFKTAELNWIGRVDSLVNMVFMWKTSPVRTFADAMKIESTLSGTGAGSTVSIYPTVMNNVFGTKFKLVMGYRGSNEAMLAVERGEVEGHSTSWTALKVAHPDWVRDNSVSILVQFALRRHADLPEIPTAVELARNDEEQAVLSAIMNASEVGTAFFTTPGVPPDRINSLRRAFDATMRDHEFVAEVQKTRVALAPITGEELQKFVAGVSNLPAGLLEKVRTAYTMPRTN
jgi:tripartite-type tricarboxylate transporter receptor subunit TctC